MSDRLFSPTYRVPGVVYKDINRDDVNQSKNSFTRHLQQPRRQGGVTNMSIRPTDQNGGKMLNPNSYATRKTVAQGMLDIALLTANASQLRYVLSLGDRHENYELMVGLIVTSLVLQVVIGIMMATIGALDINVADKQGKANVMNNIITTVTGIITGINVLLNSLGLSHDPNQTEDPEPDSGATGATA